MNECNYSVMEYIEYCIAGKRRSLRQKLRTIQWLLDHLPDTCLKVGYGGFNLLELHVNPLDLYWANPPSVC